jgi:hypothetical protein
MLDPPENAYQIPTRNACSLAVYQREVITMKAGPIPDYRLDFKQEGFTSKNPRKNLAIKMVGKLKQPMVLAIRYILINILTKVDMFPTV